MLVLLCVQTAVTCKDGVKQSFEGLPLQMALPDVVCFYCKAFWLVCLHSTLQVTTQGKQHVVA